MPNLCQGLEGRDDTQHSCSPGVRGSAARAGWWQEASLSSGGMGSSGTGVGRTAREGENGRNAEGEMVWEMFDKQIVGV